VHDALDPNFYSPQPERRYAERILIPMTPPSRIDRKFVVLFVVILGICQTAGSGGVIQAGDVIAVESQVEGMEEDGSPVIRWSLPQGSEASLRLREVSPLWEKIRSFDRLDVEFRIVSGRVETLGLRALGHVSGPRDYKMHQWTFAISTTAPEVWHHRSIDLARPNWFEWDDPDGRTAGFSFEALAIEPDTVVELRNVRLVPAWIRIKPFFENPVTWPRPETAEDGSTEYVFEIPVLNTGGKPAALEAQIISEHKLFKPIIDAPTAEVKNAAVHSFAIKATLNSGAARKAPELATETVRIQISTSLAPETHALVEIPLTVPLRSGPEDQFLLLPDVAATLREVWTKGSEQDKKALGLPAIMAAANRFLEVRLDQIPRNRNRASNNWPMVPGSEPPRRYEIGSVMPEIIDEPTGLREVGTPLADRVWVEYLGEMGRATENLGLAYVITGDERYAAKAVELMELYAKNFRHLDWGTQFEGPWSDGPAILSSSRVSGSSTYGSNWLFRLHCRMLALIQGAPSFTPEARQRIYEGFVLPYAAELMKFPGGISNMSDVTNMNLLILGLVFDDANLVRFALNSDPGLLTRMQEIDEDGFSSEGRPLNYHNAALQEYLPAMAVLHQSGIKVDIPRERLFTAVRMPYARATLWGVVPNAGDCGRGTKLGNSTMVEHLLPLFLEEESLLDWSRNSTLTGKTLQWKRGKKADRDAFRALLETTPRLFREAGLAILRSGRDPETQIMATLDYGRNPMHAHRDRNQITLSAFGRVFTHGPGTLYNAGGSPQDRDARLASFCTNGSLGQNVILVDQQNQLTAVGELLSWSEDPGRQFVTARVRGIAPGVTHTRTLALIDGVVVVWDRIQSEQDHTFDFVYHNFGELTPGPGWKQSPWAGSLGTTANYENLPPIHALAGKGPLRLGWDLTAEFLPPKPAKNAPPPPEPSPAHLALWQIAPDRAAHYTAVTGMNNPNTNQLAAPAPTLLTRWQGKEGVLVTVLEPHRGEPRVTGVSFSRDAVTITLRDAKELRLDAAECKNL